jgi:hypothetical protein
MKIFKQSLLTIFFSLSVSFYVFGQSKIIEGIVFDEKSKEPLAFATIGIKGTAIGTVTNSEGRFILAIPEYLDDSILLFSYMGYKNLEVNIKLVGAKMEVGLETDTFTLDEVEVRPWKPWDYIFNAMKHIPENYPQDPYMTNEYYSEYISENDVFLKFTEAVIETYNPPYLQDIESQSKVLKARRGSDLGTLQFMREKLEKKFEKEKRKTEKKGEVWEEKESIDEEIISASFGGPEEILSADPLRDTASYLDIRHMKRYHYSIEGYSKYFGEQVIIIGFESKGKYEHQRLEGNVFISLESDAILAIEYTSEIVIPAAVKPIIFVLGYGISNPELHAMVHYKPISERWYLNDISIQGSLQLTKKKMFSKNDRSNFKMEMGLVNTTFDMHDVHEIPEEERIDVDKALEEQTEPDPIFWESYKVVRPTKLPTQ